MLKSENLSSVETAVAASTESDSSYEYVFRALMTELAHLANSEDVQVTSFEDACLKHFSSLDSETQEKLATAVSKYIELLQASKQQDSYLVSNPNTLWRFLGLLKLRTCDDLYSNIQPEDVLEVYDLEGRQLFRSFNFFKLCSYTLEEVYSIPWMELYERDADTTAANIEGVKELFRTPELGTRDPQIRAHEVREIRGKNPHATLIKQRFISPLFDSNGNLAGFINAFQALERRPIKLN